MRKPWRRHHRRGRYQFCNDGNSRTCLPIPPRTISPSFFSNRSYSLVVESKGTDLLYNKQKNQYWEIWWDHLITEQGVRIIFGWKNQEKSIKMEKKILKCVFGIRNVDLKKSWPLGMYVKLFLLCELHTYKSLLLDWCECTSLLLLIPRRIYVS